MDLKKSKEIFFFKISKNNNFCIKIIFFQNKNTYLTTRCTKTLKRYYDNSKSENFRIIQRSKNCPAWVFQKPQRTHGFHERTRGQRIGSFVGGYLIRQFCLRMVREYIWIPVFQLFWEPCLYISLPLSGTGFWFPVNSGCEE